MYPFCEGRAWGSESRGLTHEMSVLSSEPGLPRGRTEPLTGTGASEHRRPVQPQLPPSFAP